MIIRSNRVSYYSLALFVLNIVPGWGQPFSCNTTKTPPALLRAEGKTEFVTDYVAVCSGGVAGPSGNSVNVQAYLNANITSKILNTTTGATEALLLINDPVSPIIGVNAFQGVLTTANSISFQPVPIDPPGTTKKVILRIKNVRVEASSLSGLNNPDPAIVTMFVTATGISSIPINDPQTTVGLIFPGLLFGLRKAADTDASVIDLQRPGGQNQDLATSTSASGGAVNYLIKFSEQFATAFRKRNKGTSIVDPTALADQSTPGTLYNTESGYYNSTLPSTNGLNTAGLASQGTRLIAKFNNIPAGVFLYVTTVPASGSDSARARLVNTGTDGSGFYSATTQTTTASCYGCETLIGIAPVNIVNGAGIAVWEVLGASDTDLDQFSFGLVVAYGSPKSGTPSVSGAYGPTGTDKDNLSTSPTPRFGPGPAPGATAAACSNTACLIVPGAINISYQMGSPTVPPIPIQIKSTGGPILFYATAISGQQLQSPDNGAPPGSWLSLSSGSGTTGTSSGTIALSINPAQLPAGNYAGYISVVSPGTANSPQWIYVQLAVLAQSGATSAVPMTCSVNSGVPPIVRVEGVTELIADIVMNCTGGTPTAIGAAVPATTVQITLNTEVTGRISNTDLSEALLLIDDPSPYYPNPGQQVACTQTQCAIVGAGINGVNYVNGTIPNVFQARQSSTNQLTWQVPLDAPRSGSSRIVRIVNVRANVARIGLSPTSIPNQIFANVSAPGITITGPQQTVGFIASGKTVVLANWGGPSVTNLAFLQASGANVPLVSSSSAAGGVGTFSFTMQEAFASSFKRRNVSFSVFALSNQNTPGSIYDSESGFYNAAFAATNNLNLAGLATQGTRLMAKFDNVPVGVKLYVSTTPTNAPTKAQLVATDSKGAGAYTAVPQTTTAQFGLSQIGIAPVIITNGSGMAVWEVLANDGISRETFTFGIVAAYATPTAGAATVAGLLGPTTTVDTADALAPLPRFDESGTSTYLCAAKCSIAPSDVIVNYRMGDPNPTPIALSFGTSVGPFFSLFNTSHPWMTVTQSGAIIPATVNLVIDPKGLGAGTYSGVVSTDSNSSLMVTLNITGSGLPTKASLTSPSPGSTLPSFSTFFWDSGLGVTQYQLVVGTSGVGSSDIFNQTVGSAQSQFINNLPTDGRTIFVRLGSMISGVWQYNDYTFRSGTKTVAITFASVPVNVMFNVTGLGCGAFSGVGGTNYVTPMTLDWIPGSSCSVTVSGGTGTFTTFSRWEDNSTLQPRTIVAPSTPATYIATMIIPTYRSISKVGAFGSGYWLQDLNGNFGWDGLDVDRRAFFSAGQAGEVPVSGDWNGDGKDKLGIYVNGTWILDYNGNGQWDGPSVDKLIYFGGPGWTPIVGDWNGDGKAKIGAYKDGTWMLDYDGNYAWNPQVDKLLFWGGVGYTPVLGDWNNTGWTKIGVHKDGLWLLDFDGNFAWNPPIDKVVFFGGAGYTPVTGDWNGSGNKKIGATLDGLWVIDYNGNFQWDGLATDRLVFFGGQGYIPMVGDWDGSGKTKVGAYKDGSWVLDVNGNFNWDPPFDKLIFFGGPGQTPVVGKW